MKRKTFVLLVSVVCVLATVLSLAACTGGDGGEKPDENTYVFNVVFEDTGAAAVGVRVQLCKGLEFCMMPVASDENGKVKYALAENRTPDVYDVHIIEDSIPEGYVFDNESVKTNAETREYTLTLKKKCEHVFVNGSCVKCGETQVFTYSVKAVLSGSDTDVDLSGITFAVTDVSGSKLAAMGSTDKNGVFEFVAPEYLNRDEDGKVVSGYTVRITGGVPEGYTVDTVTVFGSTSKITTVTVYPEIVSSGARTPWNPDVVKAGVVVKGKITAAKRPTPGDGFTTPPDSTYYYYAFTPASVKEAGYYRVSVADVSGGNSVSLAYFVSNIAYIHPTPALSAEGTSPSIELLIPEYELLDSDGNYSGDNLWRFGVKVVGNNVEYPVTFSLKIEKLRDTIPGKDYPIVEEVEVQLPENTPDSIGITEIVGSTEGMTLVNASPSQTLVRDENGFYHIGSADGAYAFVKISSHNPIIIGSEDNITLANVNDFSGVACVSLSEDVEDKDGFVTRYYYEYYNVLQEYAARSNNDGACLLNDQLLTFLKGYTAQQQPTLTGENAFMLGISYYE